MNEIVYARNPTAMTVAEESTAWPGVSRPTDQGGLGFGFKWNMGWMHDTLEYMKRDPIHRRHHHSEMTFGLLYAFSENFILPLSHDEVVHGKGSLLDRMPGWGDDKFANLRAYFGFMWGHPGKKLLFMGCEFAQGAEWNYQQSLVWHQLDHPQHKGVQTLVRDLNHAYRDLPALHRRDCDGSGFAWLVGDGAEESVFAFVRHGIEGDAPVVVISNMTPILRSNWRLGVPRGGRWVERINTDAAHYGGWNNGNNGGVATQPVAAHGQAQSVELVLPPLATLFLEWKAD
jgi:1,4-alpha-glucan branching enzyme